MRYLSLILLILSVLLLSACRKEDDPVSTDPPIPGQGTWSVINAQNTNQNGLPDPWVKNIFFSEAGDAYISTSYEGLSKFDGNTWDNDPWSFNSNYDSCPNGFLEDRNGRIWIISTEDIFRYEDNVLNLEQELIDLLIETTCGTPSNYEANATYILEDIEGTICIMSFWGPMIYDGEWRMYYGDGTFPSAVMNEPLFLDPDGRITFYADGIFFTYNGEEWIENQYMNTGFDPRWGCDSFYKDSSNRIWGMSPGYGVGTFDIYEFYNNNWITHEIVIGDDESQRAYNIVEDNEGNIWFGRSDGLLIYDGLSFEFMPVGDCLFVAVHPNGNIWIGQKDGILILDGDNVSEINVNGFLSDQVIKMEEAPDGSVWIMTRKGLTQYNNGQWVNNKKFGRNYYKRKSDMMIMEDETIWITNGYINHFSESGEFLSDDIDEATSVIMSQNNDLYFSAMFDGLVRLSNGQVSIINEQYSNSVVEYDGSILTGSDCIYNDDGVPFPYCQNPDYRTLPSRSNHHKNVQNIIVAQNGDLWCTVYEGIARFDGELWNTYAYLDSGTEVVSLGEFGTFTVQYENIGFVEENFLYNGRLMPIAEDHYGNIYSSYSNLLISYDGVSWNQVVPDIPVTAEITDILIRSNGDIWFSTYGEGILVYHP